MFPRTSIRASPPHLNVYHKVCGDGAPLFWLHNVCIVCFALCVHTLCCRCGDDGIAGIAFRGIYIIFARCIQEIFNLLSSSIKTIMANSKNAIFWVRALTRCSVSNTIRTPHTMGRRRQRCRPTKFIIAAGTSQSDRIYIHRKSIAAQRIYYRLISIYCIWILRTSIFFSLAMNNATTFWLAHRVPFSNCDGRPQKHSICSRWKVWQAPIETGNINNSVDG